jgi:NADPH-dependent 2,4-dienoyl-CoA reductase/sulfur reductase-like enzyme
MTDRPQPGPHLNRIVVVGASLAGLRAAETLRQRGFAGSVVVVGAETHRPYDRPPLSKKLLSGEWDADRIHLRQPDVFDDLDVEWRLGVEATDLDMETQQLGLVDGGTLDYDGLIIATGARPRRLAGQDHFAHVHELRTVDDALAVRDELAKGDRRVVVIGAGFIGLEVAATARSLGNEVIVLEGAEAPLIRGLGAAMGAAIAELHHDRGVAVRCSVQVDSLTPGGVQLGGGEHLEADVIVVGIGVEPATDWLANSGLQLRDGIVCDEALRARMNDGSPADVVFAAGDVARWTNPLFDEEMRVEHWTNAAEQGAHAANNLLNVFIGDPAEAYTALPFFWSDQYDNRIQFLGRATADDEVEIVAGSVEERKFLALFGRGGQLHGALGLNAPRWVMPTRKLFLDRASWAEALTATAGLST